MDFITHLIVIVGVFAILGMSLNLVVGFTGLLSLAHAAFFGIGAYSSAILTKTYGFSFTPVLVLSILIAVVVSLLLGLVLSRFRGDYYALASLGFTVISYTVFLNWKDITNGPFGMAGIPKPELFGLVFTSGKPYAFLIIVAAALVFGLSSLITRSSFGRVLKAIREDEEAISVFGYQTTIYKLIIFAISAGMAALAGVLYASYISYISPGSFNDMVSIYVIVIVILGGLASHSGAILGALVYVLLPELLRFVGMPDDVAALMRQVLYGFGLVLLMMYRPNGILGKYRL